MPLIQCPDCEKEISDAAPACIHCGRPAKKKTQPIARQPLPPRDAHRPMEKESGGITNFKKMEPQTPVPPPGSNAGPAIASLFIPGLGQLTQGRNGMATFYFLADVAVFLIGLLTGLYWIWLLASVVGVASAFSAATWDGRTDFSK